MRREKKAEGLLVEAENLARNRFYREAVDLYQSIWQQDTGNLKARYGMAACQYRLKRLAEAEQTVQDVLRRDPAYPRAAPLLKRIQDELKQRRPARKTLLEGCEDLYDDDGLAGPSPQDSRTPE